MQDACRKEIKRVYHEWRMQTFVLWRDIIIAIMNDGGVAIAKISIVPVDGSIGYYCGLRSFPTLHQD